MNSSTNFISNMQDISSLDYYKLIKIQNLNILDIEITVIDRKIDYAFKFNIILGKETLMAFEGKSMYNKINLFVNSAIFGWEDIRTKPEAVQYVDKKDHLDYFFKDDTDVQNIDMLKLSYFHDMNRFDPLHIVPTSIEKLKWNARVIIAGGNKNVGYNVTSNESFWVHVNRIINSLDFNRLDQMTILHENKQYLCTLDTVDYFTNLSKTSRLCVELKISGRCNEFMIN